MKLEIKRKENREKKSSTDRGPKPHPLAHFGTVRDTHVPTGGARRSVSLCALVPFQSPPCGPARLDALTLVSFCVPDLWTLGVNLPCSVVRCFSSPRFSLTARRGPLLSIHSVIFKLRLTSPLLLRLAQQPSPTVAVFHGVDSDFGVQMPRVASTLILGQHLTPPRHCHANTREGRRG